ncbi:amidohydrolase family protein [Streptomyces sp. NPDC051018]|uniref:amidohydrolase family protein n=1 Tax=Streptomyces sp. NPDC051018 TaxID=3365639 RepID=UPI0037B89A3A
MSSRTERSGGAPVEGDPRLPGAGFRDRDRDRDREHDLVLTGGRVIDPGTGLDGVRDIGITSGRISGLAGAPEKLRGRTVLDIGGLVACPGFIDLHSHGQGIAEQRLQALDGVTTALELEAGALPVAAAYAAAAEEGRPLNHGFATSWAAARMRVVGGLAGAGRLSGMLARVADPRWQAPATPAQLRALLGLLAEDLADGALGVGVLIGYAPRVAPEEFTAVARLAARFGVPVHTHARELVEADPGTPADGAAEVVSAARDTGAHLHLCHINSTSRRHVDRVLALIARAVEHGASVSTEAYPYGTGATGIGAAFLDPGRLGRWGLSPSSLVHLPTGERVRDTAHLLRLRGEDPGGLTLVELLDERDPADRGFLTRALAFPGGAVASDALPLTWPGGRPADPLRWPLPPGAVTHPRSAGTFARTLRTTVRETGLWSLPEAVRRCTLVPARIAGRAAPAMRAKGRVQPGCDADVVVFDPETISDRATYAESTRPSTGVRHLLVGGTFVVRDGEIVPDALPGRAVRGGAPAAP